MSLKRVVIDEETGLGPEYEPVWPNIDGWNLKPWIVTTAAGQITAVHLFQTPWLSFAVNIFDGPDRSIYLHDHPWNFISIMLWGRYNEDIVKEPWNGLEKKVSKERRWLTPHFLHRDWAHRITDVGFGKSRRAVTLLISGSPHRWSSTFWGPDGRVRYSDVRFKKRDK